jgi:hypothetical protein
LAGSRASLFAIAFASLAVIAGPASAQDHPFSNPAEICGIERAAEELGEPLLELLLASVGLAAQPDNPVGAMSEIFLECIELHGMLESDGAIVGSYSTANAFKVESRKRLEQSGIDVSWVDQAIARQRQKHNDDLTLTSEGVYEQMGLPEPEGLGRELVDGSEAGRMLGMFIHARVVGTIEMDATIAKLQH